MRRVVLSLSAIVAAFAAVSSAVEPAAAGSRDYYDYRSYAPPPYYRLAPTAPPPSYYPSPLARSFPRAPEYYAPPAIVYYPPPVVYRPPPVVYYPAPEYIRPASCGRYRYWNGEYCADARYRRPYVGPRW